MKAPGVVAASKHRGISHVAGDSDDSIPRFKRPRVAELYRASDGIVTAPEKARRTLIHDDAASEFAVGEVAAAFHGEAERPKVRWRDDVIGPQRRRLFPDDTALIVHAHNMSL